MQRNCRSLRAVQAPVKVGGESGRLWRVTGCSDLAARHKALAAADGAETGERQTRQGLFRWV